MHNIDFSAVRRHVQSLEEISSERSRLVDFAVRITDTCNFHSAAGVPGDVEFQRKIVSVFDKHVAHLVKERMDKITAELAGSPIKETK